MVSAFVALMLFTCVLLNGLLFVVISLFWWLRLLWQVLYWWLRLICRTGQRNKSGYVLYQSRFVCFCGSSNVLYHRPSEEVSLSSLTFCMLVYYQSQTFVSLCIKCHVFLCIMSHRSGVVFVVLLSKSLCVCCFLVSLSLKYNLVVNLYLVMKVLSLEFYLRAIFSFSYSLFSIFSMFFVFLVLFSMFFVLCISCLMI